MFGYSRGAFVVRSVAGMLHHIGALRISAANFDAQYDEALRVYHDLRNGSRKSVGYNSNHVMFMLKQ